MEMDVTRSLRCIKWLADVANEGTEMMSLTEPYRGEEIHIFQQHHTFFTENQQHEGTFLFHEARSWWVFVMKGARQTSPLVPDTICPGCPT